MNHRSKFSVGGYLSSLSIEAIGALVVVPLLALVYDWMRTGRFWVTTMTLPL